MEIAGTVAVITGGANGIGRATAIALGEAGADVVVADVDDEGARSAAADIESLGRKALAVHTDVERPEEVEELVAQAVGWQGRIDLFVSNAGVGCEGDAHVFSAKDWEQILAIDLMASIWAMRLVVPHMLERRTGHISFVSSIWGFQCGARNAPYCVAKFGLVALAESLAKQLKGTGVEVGLIVPGAVATGVSRRYRIAGADRMEPDAIEKVFAEMDERSRNWPSPESMAATIVDGIRSGRFYIAQKHPTIDDWIADVFRQRGEDPEGFVLGD